MVLVVLAAPPLSPLLPPLGWSRAAAIWHMDGPASTTNTMRSRGRVGASTEPETRRASKPCHKARTERQADRRPSLTGGRQHGSSLLLRLQGLLPSFVLLLVSVLLLLLFLLTTIALLAVLLFPPLPSLLMFPVCLLVPCPLARCSST